MYEPMRRAPRPEPLDSNWSAIRAKMMERPSLPPSDREMYERQMSLGGSSVGRVLLIAWAAACVFGTIVGFAYLESMYGDRSWWDTAIGCATAFGVAFFATAYAPRKTSSTRAK